MADNRSTPQAPEARVAQGQQSMGRVWRRASTPLYILATVLSLMLSACANAIVPPVSSPASKACICWCFSGSEAPANTTPSKALDVSPPVIADGVVYVIYAIPDATHNPRQDTYTLAALRARDGLPLWRSPTTRLTALIAVADGVIIVSDPATNHLVGLRTSDGASLWRSSLAANGSGEVLGGAASSGGVLYVFDYVNAGGDISALRINDGHILWQTRLQGPPLFRPPVVDDTSVYVALTDGSVLAVRADTGTVRWTAFTDPTASPSVLHEPLAIYSGQLYVTAFDVAAVNPAVVRLNVTDGANDGVALRLPSYIDAFYPELTADIFTTVIYPSVPPGGTSAPAPTLNGYRLSATGDGQLLWSVPVQEDGASLPIAHDAQTFYFEAAPTWVIAAYRLTDGSIRWRSQALAKGTPIVAGAGNLFETMPGVDDVCQSPLVHQAPQIRALAAASGAVAWTHSLDAAL